MERIVLVTPDPIADVLAEGDVGSRSAETSTTRAPARTRGASRRAPLTTDICADGADGAWLDFYGIVRGTEPDGSKIAAIEYEAHREMAEHQIHRILDRLEGRYPLSAVVLIHRIGVVPVGEPSLLVRILSPHRGESFQACAEFIDDLKRDVPIWKHPR